MNDALSIFLASLAALSGLSAAVFFEAARRELVNSRIRLTIHWGVIALVMFVTCIICARIVLDAAIGLI